MNYITDSNYDEFKQLYTAAVSSNSATFMFNEQLVLTAYAKYICEYVERGDNSDSERDSE